MSCSASESSPCSGLEPHFPHHSPGAWRPAPQPGPGILLLCSRSLSRPPAPAVPQHFLISSSRQWLRRALSLHRVTGEKLRRRKGRCLTREDTADAGVHTQAIGLQAQQLAQAALVGPSPGPPHPAALLCVKLRPRETQAQRVGSRSGCDPNAALQGPQRLCTPTMLWTASLPFPSGALAPAWVLIPIQRVR